MIILQKRDYYEYSYPSSHEFKLSNNQFSFLLVLLYCLFHLVTQLIPIRVDEFHQFLPLVRGVQILLLPVQSEHAHISRHVTCDQHRSPVAEPNHCFRRSWLVIAILFNYRYWV